MTGVKLAQFQEAAVEHIVKTLRDKDGSRRMLLADEVGLGKTLVARGVIENLLTHHSGPLTVIYLCSNTEIAEQNRTKLDPSGGRSIGRVTELALDRPEQNSELLLYSFTPGTSLRDGTGLAWERRLLLYLVHRVYDEPVWQKIWRNFFRCGAGEERWYAETTWRALRDEFARKTSVEFQQQLGDAWRDISFAGRSVQSALVEQVSGFSSDDLEHRKTRNRLVASIRSVMQQVALRHLRPHLVILDEVQRFRDVLDAASEPGNIAAELFARRVPVLILSATPYRALTLGYEITDTDGDHYADFFNTLKFLFNANTEAPDRIKKTLAQFGQRLRQLDLLERSDHDLLQLKRDLEEDLRKVICRTERNWYVLDRHKGIEEVADERRALPRRAELEEYLRLHRALGTAIGSTAQVTEFWKSAPSLLTFLDARYALLRRLRDNRAKVPRALLAPAGNVGALANRNHRIQCVVEHSIGKEGSRPHLWIRPTYMYYRDQFFGATPPRKLLVFSGWRFVPKTIAIIASRVALDRLGGDPEDPSQPLKFSDRRSFHVFDVCFPSPALAAVVKMGLSADQAVIDLEAGDIVDETVSRLRNELKNVGISVVPSGGDATWRVVARFEQLRDQGDQIRKALDAWQPADGDDEPSAAVLQHRDWVKAWLNDRRPSLQLNEARLRRLALVAAFSPANSLWRALAGVYGIDNAEKAFPEIAALCLGAMRRYFNRPHVQQTIRQHEARLTWPPTHAGRERGYAERVLLYAAEAHLQAVLDEYAYLQRHAAQSDTVGKAIAQLEHVWKLSRGSPRTNRARGRGPMVSVEAEAEVHATHFALAFGDDVSRDTGPDEEDARLRKSDVREAFNSPFWPFVLATTSVGQEGLDFHLYCRDVLHWNLPSNPVDLEQREGRINRRDCLAVRSSIAREWPITHPNVSAAFAPPYDNVWRIVFQLLEQHDDPQRYKHGLYPHWVYECKDPQQTVRIQRHVPFFATSRDAAKYERLKTGLALYRLVFGQANQEDLLDRLQERIDPLLPQERDRILRRLASYMLNLSPIGREQALRQASGEAAELLCAENRLAKVGKLINDVTRLREEHPSELDDVSAELDGLMETIRNAFTADDTQSDKVRRAVGALAYVRNPYDHIFDLHVEGGFADDIDVVRDAWKSVIGTSEERRLAGNLKKQKTRQPS